MAVPDDLGDGPAVRPGYGLERPVGRIAQADEVGDIVIGRHAEDPACLFLVADPGVATADAEVGGGHHDRVRCLAEVVAIDLAGMVVLGLRDDQRNGRGRLARTVGV